MLYLYYMIYLYIQRKRGGFKMKYKSKISVEVYDFLWQKYVVGLYIAVYKDGRIFDQICFDGEVKDFLSHLESQGFIKV